VWGPMGDESFGAGNLIPGGHLKNKKKKKNRKLETRGFREKKNFAPEMEANVKAPYKGAITEERNYRRKSAAKLY